ncbi:hypothetical protein GCM10027347_58740 [Larkinella harenae]
MNKTLTRRSNFQLITVNSTTVAVALMVEADEVYLTQVGPSTVGAHVRRQRERDFANFLAANPTITTGATHVWGLMDVTYGRVNLDHPLTSDGKFMNRPVTTAANDLTQPERAGHLAVGVKELLEFKASAAGTAYIIVEQVHYIPAGEIGV